MTDTLDFKKPVFIREVQKEVNRMDARLYILTIFLGLSACSLMQRSPRSMYSSHYGRATSKTQDFYRQKRLHERRKTLQEMGYSSTTLGESEQQALALRLEVKRLEDQLQHSLEKRQYYSYKPYFKSDSERARFLSLPTMEARERWAQSQGVKSKEIEYDPQTLVAIENGDISIGMSREAVIESWGDPYIIEVAGNRLYGNERWKYSKMVSTSEGYTKQLRMIYFESGRVAGWESL
jgi:hypothetical protein